jgi:hypothetical protein
MCDSGESLDKRMFVTDQQTEEIETDLIIVTVHSQEQMSPDEMKSSCIRSEVSSSNGMKTIGSGRSK